MRRYFLNLWLAMIGRNPYSEELKRVSDRYDKASVNFHALQNQYLRSLEMLDEQDKRESDLGRQVLSLQRLVENLRQRVREYQERIGEYNREINNLVNNKKV